MCLLIETTRRSFLLRGRQTYRLSFRLSRHYTDTMNSDKAGTPFTNPVDERAQPCDAQSRRLW